MKDLKLLDKSELINIMDQIMELGKNETDKLLEQFKKWAKCSILANFLTDYIKDYEISPFYLKINDENGEE